MGSMQGVPWEPIAGREGIKVKYRVMLPEVARKVPEARECAPGARTRRRPNIEKRAVDKFGISSGRGESGSTIKASHGRMQEEDGSGHNAQER